MKHEQREKVKRQEAERGARSGGAQQAPGEEEKELQREWRDGAKATATPALDATADGSKVRCCEEQYCVGTCNARSVNQGKSGVVKQETARVNVDTRGISALKWTRTGEFNSDDHYIYYCGQDSLRRNGVAIRVNKRVQNAVLWCSLKKERMSSVHLQGKPFNSHSNPSLCLDH